MGQYSINDLEKLSGIKASLIRVWERRYKIIRPSRTETNRRRYDDAQLRKIINISILQRNGFKISLIAALSDHEIEEKVTFLSKNTTYTDTKVDSLIKLMIAYDEKAINDLLIRSFLYSGFEETMDQVVFPLFNRIGIMWQTGSAGIGSEHFISNIFRQRMILAIESLPLEKSEGNKRVILFLPENELHEIGLLYYLYIIRKLGHEALYLGQTTPLSTVIDVNDKWNADIIITGIMSGYPDVNPDEYIRQLSGSFPNKKVLVSGILADLAVKMNLPNIFPAESTENLKTHFK